MKIQIEAEPKEIAALVVALQERQVNCYEIAKSIQDAIQDRTELFQPFQHETCDTSKIKGITVDLASHDIPQAKE